MTSIYQQAMGAEFEQLHPQIQARFGFCSEDGKGAIGRGVMSRVWHGPFYVLPFLYVGAWRNIMFPAKGVDIPFTIENYAYQDRYGRETVTWVRTFQFPQKVRRFDATMIYSEGRRRIIDYLGNRQHLAVDIEMTADSSGGICLRSGEQRFYEGVLGFRFPMFLSGVATVREWFDEADGRFQIEVSVRNRLFGKLFGYRGSFEVEYVAVGDGEVPLGVRPLREEWRD